MFAGVPLAFTFGFDAGAVDKQVQQAGSGSNQIESEPRCFNAVFYEGQFLVLCFAGDELLMPHSYYAGFTP